MADNSARIAEIQDILRNGVVEDEVDGQRTKIDSGQLRRELRKLILDDDTLGGIRPVSARIDLGGF